MIDVVRFNPKHLQHLDLQEEQQFNAQLFKDPAYVELLLTGEAYTVLHDGEIILIAGVLPLTDYMARAWALVSQNAGRALIPASRKISDFLKNVHYARVETPVRRGFINGHRWAKLLGFTNETPERGMKCYGFEGETYDLYAIYPKGV